MPHVGVLFELRKANSVPGEGICCTGSRPELGAWLTDDGTAPRLFTSGLVYPRWFTRAPVWLEVPDNHERVLVEYKFVRDQQPTEGRGDAQIQWEGKVPNRRVELPGKDGSVWVVSDAQWNTAAEPPTVTHATAAEMDSWRCGLDPDWAPPGTARGAVGPKKYDLTPRTPGGGFGRRAGQSIEEFHLTPRVGSTSGGTLSSRGHAIEEVYEALSLHRILRMLGFHRETAPEASPAIATATTLRMNATANPTVPPLPMTLLANKSALAPMRLALPGLQFGHVLGDQGCFKAQPISEHQEEDNDTDSLDDELSDVDTISLDGSLNPDGPSQPCPPPPEELETALGTCPQTLLLDQITREKQLTREIQRLFALLPPANREEVLRDLARYARGDVEQCA